MEDSQLFRSLKGQSTPAEEARLRTWRQRSTERERSYEELGVVLEATAATDRPPATEPPSVFKLIHEAETRLASEQPERPEPGRHSSRRFWFPGLAVACALALGFGISHWWLAVPTQGRIDASEIATGRSERAMLTLADGTVVRLGPESRLQILGRSGARAVSLEGRAFFAVAHDPERPFLVATDAADVEVLGTRFDLQTEGDGLRVSVVEGRVSLLGRGGRSEVGAGEMQRVAKGTMLPAAPIPDVREATGWMGDFLVFQETPLADAAKEIEALYGVQIEITEERIGQQTITTWFVDQPFEQVIEIFCLVAEAECTTVGNHTTVRPRTRPL